VVLTTGYNENGREEDKKKKRFEPPCMSSFALVNMVSEEMKGLDKKSATEI